MGVHWVADCVMQSFIILGSIDYNNTLFTILTV